VKNYLFVNGRIVNEGRILEMDVLVERGRIAKIGAGLSAPSSHEVIDLQGRYLLPGLIDDQVHFREPGLTHKATIASESLAAVCGGVTSFMDMPNNDPPTTDRGRLAEKAAIAEASSYANYGFYLGATNDNLEEIRRIQRGEACGIKVFMGASTGNMLVDDPVALERIFSEARLLIATHCEDSPSIWRAEREYRKRFGDDVPMWAHPKIRSAEACYKSSALAVALAKRHDARLHILHLTTAKELQLFESGAVTDKRITAEVCVHHLWFDESRYEDLGTRIKCNPAIKTAADREALVAGLNDDRIDVVATDHAPHTLEEKSHTYFGAPAGLPLVQHSLAILLELHRRGALSLERIVQKAAHNPARLFGIAERGFIREGFFADLVAVDLHGTTAVTPAQLRYKCGWSPFEGDTFHSEVKLTMVNGEIAYRGGVAAAAPAGRALTFDAD
jgi:dihydroorotase